MAVPEEVKEFNKQLNSILETSLPISRAKMTAITKAAINARMQYKHIVMLVEKFISKCSPEYKVPGLYVIDSIVRQSRNASKNDVFGPRFARNLPTTFTHIFKCKEEDLPRVIKVLNLWQKNGTFSTEVIQPLHQLAPQATSLAPRPEQPPDMSVMQPATSMLQPSQSMMQSASSVQHASSMMQPAPSMMQPAPPMMQHPVDMEQSPSPPPPNDRPLYHPRVPPSLHTPSLQSLLEEVSLDKTLIAKVKEQLNNSSPAQDSPGREEHFLHQRELRGEMNSGRPMSEERWGRSAEPAPPVRQSRWGPEPTPTDSYPEWGMGPSWGRRSPPPPAPEMWGDHQGKGRPPDYPNLGGEPYHQPRYPHPDGPEVQGFPSGQMRDPLPYEGGPYPPGMPPPFGHRPPPPSGSSHFDPPPGERLPPPEFRRRAPPHDVGPPPPIRFGEWRGGPPPGLPHPREDRGWGRWSPRRRRSSRSPRRSPSPPRFARGRSRSRSPRRGRSLSPRRGRGRPMSRSPRRRSRSSRSPPRRPSRSPRRPSRSPRRDGSNEEDAVLTRKAEHITVWSTTIWVGRIKGTVQGDELQRMLEKFGRVLHVEVITQRGCVYITMATRRDAEVVHRELKYCELPIDQSKKGGRGKQNIEVAWAPGRGCKGSSFKAYWVLKQGVTVIPWSHVKEQEELNALGDGGEVDLDTLPPGLQFPPLQEGPLPDESQPPFLPPVGENNLL